MARGPKRGAVSPACIGRTPLAAALRLRVCADLAGAVRRAGGVVSLAMGILRSRKPAIMEIPQGLWLRPVKALRSPPWPVRDWLDEP
jgi:hypothetical protein